MNILELFTPRAIAAHWTEVLSNRIPYLGEGLFPAQKKAGLDLSWLKGHKGLPVSLMPSAFDAKATFRDRPGLEKLETEMPFFREGFKIKERDRQELMRVLDSNDPYARTIIARIFDDYANLVEGAMVVPERMRMALLFADNGNVGITIKANGVDYSYNYDPNGAWKANNYTALTGTSVWTDTANADPFSDIQTAVDGVAQNTGVRPVHAVMNTKTFNLLAKIDAVKDRFLTQNGKSVAYLTAGDVKNVITSTNQVSIALYDKQYKDEDGTAHSFVPDNYVALIPQGALGSTWYGTTPEEADLAGSGQGEVAIVNTGVAISRIVDPHPVNVNLFASEIVLPSYERMDEVALLKVV